MVGVGVVLAVLLLSLAVALAIPVRVAFRVERTDRFRGRWHLRWLLGLVDVEPGSAKKPKAQKPPRKERGRPRRVLRAALAMLRTPGFVPRAGRLIRDLSRHLSWEDLRLRAEFGLDDPADTGRIYGALAPLLLIASGRGWPVDCRPDYLRPGFQGSCAVTVQARPIVVVWLIGGFFCSPAVWRAIRAWRSRA